MQVVVLDERDAARKRRIQRPPVDALQMMLAGVVGRMCLAREHDLHRATRRTQDACQAFGIVEDERRAACIR